MMSFRQDLQLPAELILHIISFICPRSSQTLIPTYDGTSQTLLSLMQVSRLTHAAAIKIFRQHCIYIDSNAKAQAFAQCLERSLGGSRLNVDTALRGITSLYLSPFVALPQPEETEIEANATRRGEERYIHRQSDERGANDYHHLDSDNIGDSGDNENNHRGGNDSSSSSSSSFISEPSPLSHLPTVRAIRQIFQYLSPTLSRLVISLPLRSLYPEDDHTRVRPILRSAFELLENIEEFVSVQDELYLSTIEERPSRESLVWATFWPKLRRLSLYNPALEPDERIWGLIASLAGLETVVFVRADGLDDMYRNETWSGALVAAKDGGNCREKTQKPLTITLVNIASEQPPSSRHPALTQRIANLLPNRRIRVLLSNVPMPPVPGGSDGDILSFCPTSPRWLTQDWVQGHAVRGTLWDQGQNMINAR